MMTPSRPYLIRAIYEWIADNEFTPYLEVAADHEGLVAPPEYIQNNKIIFNISVNATNNLRIGNDAIEFDARFGLKITHIFVPISAVNAIFADENHQGLSFQKNLGLPDEYENITPSPKPKKAELKIIRKTDKS